MGAVEVRSRSMPTIVDGEPSSASGAEALAVSSRSSFAQRGLPSSKYATTPTSSDGASLTNKRCFVGSHDRRCTKVWACSRESMPYGGEGSSRVTSLVVPVFASWLMTKRDTSSPSSGERYATTKIEFSSHATETTSRAWPASGAGIEALTPPSSPYWISCPVRSPTTSCLPFGDQDTDTHSLATVKEEGTVPYLQFGIVLQGLLGWTAEQNSLQCQEARQSWKRLTSHAGPPQFLDGRAGLAGCL